jgi:heptosyltransferase II
VSLPADLTHLIVRLPNWLGDTVMALPALRALRSGLDGRRISLVGPWAPLLAGQGVADAWVSYPRGARRRLAAARGLRRLGGDTVLLLPNSIESSVAAWLWGARWIIGYATDARGPLLTHALLPPVPRRHQVDEYLGLLAPLGIAHAEATPRWIPEGDAQKERLEALLPSTGGNARPRVGVHLGAAFGPSKLWPAELIAALCRELDQRRLATVLLGTPSEEAIANRIVAAAGGDLISLVGRDAPELLPGLLARLDVLVSMDTGVAHLAAAVGVPLVALFGPTDPGLTAPRGAGASVIWKPPPCAPCFLTECPIEHPCMRAIGVEEVVEAVEARLGARRR